MKTREELDREERSLHDAVVRAVIALPPTADTAAFWSAIGAIRAATDALTTFRETRRIYECKGSS